MTVDAATDTAYVACSRSDAVAVVDLTTLRRTAMVPVGREPIDIVIDPVTRQRDPHRSGGPARRAARPVGGRRRRPGRAWRSSW
ncbi:MAG: YncE family protein [Acidimicrobiales bacterium]